MPIYDYKCQKHGLFHELVEISDSGENRPCPECQIPCPQVIVVAPSFLNMDSHKRQACACNERAQHAPLKSSQIEHAPSRSNKLLLPDASMSKSSRTLINNDGTKTFIGQRPWMISH